MVSAVLPLPKVKDLGIEVVRIQRPVHRWYSGDGYSGSIAAIGDREKASKQRLKAYGIILKRKKLFDTSSWRI